MTRFGNSGAGKSATILCADDYAMTLGISDGIEQLAAAGRLSATSAMVTTPHWPSFGPRVAKLRLHIAVGLHFNLTLGHPLGPMPQLAPDSRFGAVGDIVKLGLRGGIVEHEIEAELTRQLDQFQGVTGRWPDFIDGHQHVHALPGVRKAFLKVIKQIPWQSPPLIRDPADTMAAIAARGAAPAKSLMLAGLARGFGHDVRVAGFPTNDGFSGASAFAEGQDFGQELTRFMSRPGSRHLVMCHPGHVDVELAGLDPVVGRREQEFAAIAAFPGLVDQLWHPVRQADGAINWGQTHA
jgi:chitin disaccharide deacetylase